jgi:nucleoside-diphosphate-sugar epimerase
MRTIRDCSVCVAGGAGFLGSHLVNYLIDDRKCKVLVIDNLVSGHRSFVHPKARFIHTDITSSEHYLHQLLSVNKIEYVFNYAASPYVPLSFERPLHVFNINAMGALKLINAAEEAGCKGVLQVSSAEIYGGLKNEAYKGKMTEDFPVSPHSSYGASKAAIDAMVQVRWKEAGTPVIAMRQFNCVGERETHPYVIPEIISQLNDYNPLTTSLTMLPPLQSQSEVNGPPIIKLGNNSNRDFQYAGDAVCMAVELLEKGEFGQVYNMGSESYTSIYMLAEMIGRLMGYPEIEIVAEESRKRPWEIWHLQSDTTKLYSVIETRPKISLEEALRRTIQDFHNNGERWFW